MADSKLSALAELAATDVAVGDLFYVDDISVTTSKKITAKSLGLVANADVAAHATTMDIWVAREITLTGAAVNPITGIVDAPYVGAVAWVKQNAAHVWTDGAVFDVQGGASYTAAAGDWIRVYATTVSTFDVTIFPANGKPVSYSETSFTATLTGCTTAPTYTVYATKVGNVVTLNIPAWTGTSNATTKTFTGMPASLRPTNAQGFLMATQNNTATQVVSQCTVEASGVIDFRATAAGGAFTASGTASKSVTSATYQAN